MILGIDASRANREQKTGVEWYAYFIIQELKKIIPSDWEVRLYTEKPLTGDLAVLPAHWHEQVLRWPPKRLWTQVRLSWEMVVHTPDILFVPAHVPPYIHPKKTVLTVHDVAAKDTPGAYNWFEKWYSLWTAEEAILNLPSLIVPTQAVQMDLQRMFTRVDTNKIHVVHHGINPEFWRESSVVENEAVVSQYNLSKPYILAVGRIEEKKNSAGLVRSFAEARAAGYAGKLVFVGKPGFGYETVEKAIKKSGVAEHIVMLNWLPTEHLVSVMRQASALVFPSFAEGFGLPVLEGMAAGVPVIATDVPSVREVGGNAAQYVDPNQMEQWAKAIVEIDQPVNQARFRHLGKARASQFSWAISAAKTWEVIKLLCP